MASSDGHDYRGKSHPGGPLLARAVTAAKQGDTAALTYLHACYADELLDYLVAIGCDPAESEGITRRVLAELPRTITTYQEGDPFSDWLTRAARKAAVPGCTVKSE
jgi:DNA-directed RNA polymerase specialized sigma24 family protein